MFKHFLEQYIGVFPMQIYSYRNKVFILLCNKKWYIRFIVT